MTESWLKGLTHKHALLAKASLLTHIKYCNVVQVRSSVEAPMGFDFSNVRLESGALCRQTEAAHDNPELFRFVEQIILVESLFWPQQTRRRSQHCEVRHQSPRADMAGTKWLQGRKQHLLFIQMVEVFGAKTFLVRKRRLCPCLV